jgi:hypothetical protein
MWDNSGVSPKSPSKAICENPGERDGVRVLTMETVSKEKKLKLYILLFLIGITQALMSARRFIESFCAGFAERRCYSFLTPRPSTQYANFATSRC